MSNGTTLNGIESLSLTTGAGNDSYTITAPVAQLYLAAGAGTDSLNVDFSADTEARDIYIGSSQGDGYFYGSLIDGSFVEFENVTYRAGDADNYVYLGLQGIAPGNTLNIDAGGGANSASVAIFNDLDVVMTVDAQGTLNSNIGVTMTNFQSFSLQTYGGDDQIVTGAGNDIISTGDGDDTVDGGDGNDSINTGDGEGIVNAGAGNDIINAGSGDDTIDAGVGDDQIFAGDGDNTIDGGEGNDYIYTGEGQDTVDDGGGSDTIFTNGGNDTVTSDGGDTIYTGEGDDSVSSVGLGFSQLDGGDGTDTLEVDFSSSTGGNNSYFGYFGGVFNGVLAAGDATAYVNNFEVLSFVASDEDDLVSVYGDALPGTSVSVDGGAGDDLLFLAFGDEDLQFAIDAGGLISTNAGSFANFESFTIIGGAGDDLITTGDGDDYIEGREGTNVLIAGAGDDQINSSNGSDTIDGGEGEDAWYADYYAYTDDLDLTYDGHSGSLSNGTTLAGIEHIELTTGSGNDSLTLTAPVLAFLFAGDGTDTLNVDFSDDLESRDIFIGSSDGSISGNLGDGGFGEFENLTYNVGDGDTALTLYVQGFTPDSTIDIDGGGGNNSANVIIAQEFDAILTVDAGGTLNTNVGATLTNFQSFSLQTFDGNDQIVSGSGDDVIDTGYGQDTIDAGDGNDTIYAGNDDDVITGGKGADDMFGQGGADTFVFESLDDLVSAGGNDTIELFSSAAGDKIDLSNVVAGEFSFLGTDAFTASGAAELRYDDAGDGTKTVFGDVDGDGNADFQLVVINYDGISAADFFL